MKINQNKRLMITTLILVVTSMALVSGANIGISPAKINYENVLRGGYAEKITTITVDSDNEVDVEATPWGNISEWINLSETKFKVTRDNPHYLTISVSPPKDIPNGNYSGFIRVKISGLSRGNELDGHATGIINPVLDLYVVVQVTDVEFSECRARNFKVYSAEKGEDIIFRTDVLNQGNIRLNPRIKIDIWDQEQIELLYSEEFSNKQITPTKEEEVEIKVPSKDLDLGQYWAEISAIDCYSSQTLTFDVLKEGSLKAEGNLIKILSAPWIDEKDTTKIEAFFRNTGQKDVTAYFKGKITQGDKTIQLIESEKTEVRMGKEGTFEFYFTPQKAGRYVVTGRVFYDNKRTFEKSAIINARPTGINLTTILKYIAFIILLGGIVYLTYKIKQEKKEYKRKTRRLK